MYNIKERFNEKIYLPFVKAVEKYCLISDGDKIAVCISGGKDSMLMAKLFMEYQKESRINFKVEYIVMDPGYNEENRRQIEHNIELLGIPAVVFQSDIFDVINDVDKSPCYLCARMRRGCLYGKAKELGCNKIALGHHYDDVIETTLLSIFYSAEFKTMMPKLHSDNFKGMELIRPLYLIKEKDIIAWTKYNNLEFINCACKFTEKNAIEGKRMEVKKLISELRKKSKYIEQNIFKSTERVNLSTIIGYYKDDFEYNFLDDYEEK